MDPKFAKVVDSLQPSLERLLNMEPLRGTAPSNRSTPKSGVYLFSEQDRHLYVGRSNRLAARYRLHCSRSAQHNQASFAWKLMAESVGHSPTHRKGEGRGALIQREDYQKAFMDAKERVRKMDYRFVEEGDQTRQALLEAYVAIVLETPYNDFNTH